MNGFSICTLLLQLVSIYVEGQKTTFLEGPLGGDSRENEQWICSPFRPAVDGCKDMSPMEADLQKKQQEINELKASLAKLQEDLNTLKTTGGIGNNSGSCQKRTVCPDGFYFNEQLQSCYLFQYVTNATWFESNAFCNAMGAHLVSIETAEEHTWLVQKIKDDGSAYKYRLDTVWHGGTDDMYALWTGGSMLTGTFGWAGGPCFDPKVGTFTKWAPGQPDNANGKEQCTLLWAAMNFDWGDWYCWHRMHFICEIDL
ncbi:unnamed protein product [Owenia fusiformis]|uniref:C-type lectin domain-containing protein n=1 Tax=Owenia fusiformis TaxID=6347 RepID=A0A8S4PMP1_OWEFU|nr:unnamed protein product [Owenia fusiformis]